MHSYFQGMLSMEQLNEIMSVCLRQDYVCNTEFKDVSLKDEYLMIDAIFFFKEKRHSRGFRGDFKI